MWRKYSYISIDRFFLSINFAKIFKATVMNLKTIMAGLCLFGLWVGNFPANNPKTMNTIQITNDVPHGYEQIELRGSLMLNAGPTAIEVGVSDDAIYVQFNQNFGNVTVTIYDPNGLIIYSDMVNTAVQQLLVIPVSLNNEGIYTIVLENATGYADGDFEIQP